MVPDWVYSDEDRSFMRLAFEQARAAGERGEVPVGAVVVRDKAVIAGAGNQRSELADPTAHAEILALRQAGRRLADWRLQECTLYVTLEPCPMCTAACRQARLGLVVWGAADPVAGACGTCIDLAEDPSLGPPLAHRGGLLAEQSTALLQAFFAKTRESS